MQEISSIIGVRRKCCNSDKEAFDLTLLFTVVFISHTQVNE